MADTHKDLDFLRYFHASESSLKDKDRLKAEVFEDYQKRVSLLAFIPLGLQVAHISMLNRS